MPKRYKVDSNAAFSLASISAADEGLSAGDKNANKKAVKALSKSIDKLQDVFYANGSKRLLLVLQGMDTSGKDGTVKKIFQYCDPLGIQPHSFKKPTPAELSRDYLWRVHQCVPQNGQIAIFNRSHYEDVLITRVHDWISEEECVRRYRQINEFERHLTETRTIIVKCMLHISYEQQLARLQARLDDPQKHWKFSMGDIEERKLWPSYQRAYEKMLNATSTEYAPWHVIPSDNKWHRNLVVAQLLHDTLRDLSMEYPSPVKEYFSLKIS